MTSETGLRRSDRRLLGGKPIAHIMLSFGFEGKDYLAISIETRKGGERATPRSPASSSSTSWCTSWPTSGT